MGDVEIVIGHFDFETWLGNMVRQLRNVEADILRLRCELDDVQRELSLMEPLHVVASVSEPRGQSDRTLPLDSVLCVLNSKRNG